MKSLTRRRRGAALVEYGMVIGLIAVASIGSVLATGRTVEDVYCTAAAALADPLNRDAWCTEVAEAEPDSDAAEPVIPPGVVDGNFVDIHYPMNTTGQHYVFTDARGQFEEAAYLYASSDEGIVRPCRIDAGVADPVCGGNWVELNSDTVSFGYRVDLPADAKAQVLKVAEITAKRGGVALEEWNVEISRTPAPYVFEPEMEFGDAIYAAGSTGWQEPIVEVVAGRFNADIDLNIVWETGSGIGGYDIELCVQALESDPVTCDAKNFTSGSQRVDPASIHAIGYRINLPDDAKLTVEDTIAITLDMPRSDPYRSKIWQPRVYREAEPYVFQPSMSFGPVAYAAGATGWQEPVMEVLSGAFNDELRLGVIWTSDGRIGRSDVEACHQAVEGGEVVCRGLDYDAVSTLFDPEATYAIGYRVALPGDDKVAVDEALTVELSMPASGDAVVWAPPQHRDAVPYLFAPDMKITGRSYAAGQTGMQEPVMFEVEGAFNDKVQIRMVNDPDGSISLAYMRICVQNRPDSGIACTSANFGRLTYQFDPATTYRIGYKVRLRAEGSVVDDTASYSLEMPGSGDDPVVYPLEFHRPAS